MTEPRSSSNRQGRVQGAVVVQRDALVGPVRLPDHRAEDFIESFNRRYEGLGMQLKPIPTSNEESTVDGETDRITDVVQSDQQKAQTDPNRLGSPPSRLSNTDPSCDGSKRNTY